MKPYTRLAKKDSALKERDLVPHLCLYLLKFEKLGEIAFVESQISGR